MATTSAEKSRTPSPRRRRRALVVGVAATVVAASTGLGTALAGGSGNAATAAAIPWASLPGLQTGPLPWGSDVGRLAARLKPLKLSELSAEGTVIHIHQHLDLYVAGKKVTLPAGVGIDDDQFITEVHTHDTSGVIHVESPTERTFTLGQLFGEWGVKLTPTCVGRYCGKLAWWVDGKRRQGDPAALVLRAHQEIAIAEGPPPFVVPRSYAFPAGE